MLIYTITENRSYIPPCSSKKEITTTVSGLVASQCGEAIDIKLEALMEMLYYYHW